MIFKNILLSQAVGTRSKENTVKSSVTPMATSGPMNMTNTVLLGNFYYCSITNNYLILLYYANNYILDLLFTFCSYYYRQCNYYYHPYYHYSCLYLLSGHG